MGPAGKALQPAPPEVVATVTSQICNRSDKAPPVKSISAPASRLTVKGQGSFAADPSFNCELFVITTDPPLNTWMFALICTTARILSSPYTSIRVPVHVSVFVSNRSEVPDGTTITEAPPALPPSRHRGGVALFQLTSPVADKVQVWPQEIEMDARVRRDTSAI
jgi:hypothetical protein